MSCGSVAAPGAGRRSLLSWLLRVARRGPRPEQRAAGPAGESALGRLTRLQRDEANVVELDARLRRDVGLAPREAGDDIAELRADITLRVGGYR